MELIAPESAQAARAGIPGARRGHGQADRFREVSGDEEALRHVHVASRLHAGLELLKRLAENSGNVAAGEERASVEGLVRLGLAMTLCLRLRLSLVPATAEFCVLRRTSGQPGKPERRAQQHAK